MSVESDVIDLNSDALPVEGKSGVDVPDSLGSRDGIVVSAAETLVEPSGARVWVDGHRPSVDVDGVLGELEEAVHGGVVGGERGDRVSEGREALIGDRATQNGGEINLSIKGEVSRSESEVDGSCLDKIPGQSNSASDEKVEKEKEVEKVEVSYSAGVESNMSTVGLDLNSRDVADSGRKSENGVGDNKTEVKEFSSVPTDSLAHTLACDVNEVDLNAIQDAVIAEQVIDTEQNVKHSKAESEWIEKEGEFLVSDLVWGKVRSHPWWPGQIFESSAAAKKAMKYFKKDSFLIAYFGDQTFAWNDASRIKPFRIHFSEMEKQSNSELFGRAVNCALEEGSRRVEFGLACSCLSEEVYDKIKTQVFVNAGIQKESSRKDGGDRFSSAACFTPTRLVQSLKALAQDPMDESDRLEGAVAKAQLFAFNRWKGYHQLATLDVSAGLLPSDTEEALLEEDPDTEMEDSDMPSWVNEQVSSGKGKSIAQDSSSRKRKHISGDSGRLSKKVRCMSDLLSEVKAGKRMSLSSSGKKRKAVASASDDSKMENIPVSPQDVSNTSSAPKTSLRVGERMQRVASQLSGSTPILKNGKTSKRTGSKNGGKPAPDPKGISPSICDKSRRVDIGSAKNPPTDEMLSQLCLAAEDPTEGYSFVISIISFFTNFRNSLCLTKSDVLSNSEAPGTRELGDTEDSYWTDRVIEGNPEQVLFEPETEVVEGVPTVEPEFEVIEGTPTEPESSLNLSPTSDYKQETAAVTPENGHSPTALILNFADLDSVPSITNLNQIFSRYGPLNELETEVLTKSKRAKVVFKKRSDAETAFSSAGKFSIFGPSLVSYRLNFAPTPRKASSPATKRSKKDATSVEGNEVC